MDADVTVVTTKKYSNKQIKEEEKESSGLLPVAGME
jgi:hypothetical protein